MGIRPDKEKRRVFAVCVDGGTFDLIRPWAREGYLDPGDFEWFSNAIFEPRTPVSGTHKPNGIFLLVGEGVRQGIELKNPRIYDIAPSVLYLMDIPIPGGMDGKVLTDAFNTLGHHPGP